MKAVKGNRCYTITEADAKRFASEGYDVKDENGNIVAYGAGKTVPFEIHQALIVKYAELEKEIIALRKSANKKAKKPAKESDKAEE